MCDFAPNIDTTFGRMSSSEIVFDQGLGDLFVVRVAGNVAAPSQIGSVEYAGEQFGTQLVVVLGHSHCGVVTATLDALTRHAESYSKNLRAIIDRVRLTLEPLLEAGSERDPEDFLSQAVRANVSASAEQLRQGSEVLENLIQQDKLLVVGAEYSLETGLVDFFDGVPEE